MLASDSLATHAAIQIWLCDHMETRITKRANKRKSIVTTYWNSLEILTFLLKKKIKKTFLHLRFKNLRYPGKDLRNVHPFPLLTLPETNRLEWNCGFLGLKKLELFESIICDIATSLQHKTGPIIRRQDSDFILVDVAEMSKTRRGSHKIYLVSVSQIISSFP